MMEFVVTARIPAEEVRSLCWDGDSLVDWCAGGRRFRPDGTVSANPTTYGEDFDAVAVSPSGKYTAIYERRGQVGLLLTDGKVLRQLPRDEYHADDYEYPIAFARLDSGDEVLIHCPQRYDRMEIEHVATGECLTRSDNRKPVDNFYSRLAICPSGEYFLSAGWYWHPYGTLGIYRLADAIRDPRTLDGDGLYEFQWAEPSAAAFADDSCVIVTTTVEFCGDEEELADPKVLRPNSLSVWNPKEMKFISQVPVTEIVGNLVPIDARFVVGFYDHPKIFDLTTGQVVARLEGVRSGLQNGSILRCVPPLPPLAIDRVNRRFALATPSEILMVRIVPPAVPN